MRAMNQISQEAYRYNKWANLHLLDVCAGLTPEQLQLTSPGTYGSIAATWLHLLSAEQRYIKNLGGSEQRISEKHEFPGIAALKTEAERSGDELIQLSQSVDADVTIERTSPRGRYRQKLWVPLVQAIHHGNDHRTHICTILGDHGISYGDMDVWAYAEAVDALADIEVYKQC
jgi:uncharacterized damage-inducible protein DinB